MMALLEAEIASQVYKADAQTAQLTPFLLSRVSSQGFRTRIEPESEKSNGSIIASRYCHRVFAVTKFFTNFFPTFKDF